jgi:hypothetical protein
VGASLSQLPSYLQSPRADTPTSEAPETFSPGNPAPNEAEDSPPPSPPASPAASMEVAMLTHQSPALGDTGQRLQQLIRDAEGNAMLWADVKQVRTLFGLHPPGSEEGLCASGNRNPR